MTSNINWPSTLPQSPLLDGFSEQGVDQLIRTQMDASYAKQRPRTTYSTRNRTVTFLFTNTEKNIFEDFFTNTIFLGSLSFNMPSIDDPTVTEEVRFVAGTYAKTYVGPKWKYTLNLEIYPK